ncbi:branched-chain amino acid ABC transporter permease [Pseudoflavonifractor phocaeensis]|uniref:branched-chain amino acid ABC transporter permease n=1 Tax=Pseudoflavonifractor phocaeensis TaxID=1870988 RepID=UPI0019590318|nr:branched-chain amino acid ABC transporter permease [Pseudoflavonifractor phocaeensis]MBM6721806.1 branched-chain amino acid ABC transporter permease [Pseudoflavonifractor phocaeensis]
MKKLSPDRKRLVNNCITYGIVIAAFVILQVCNAGGLLSPSIQGQLVPICAYVVMAIALNLVVGISGELSLGHAGFMSVGAFSGVVAALSLQNSIPNDGLRLAIAMVVGAVLAGVAGVIVGVPVLRLRGDYLAIVTLAFGEIIRNIFNVLYVGVDENGLHFSLQNEMALNLAEGGKSILKGPMGFTTNVKLATFTAGFILVLITLTIALNLINSRSGRAIMALRDNRIAAESVGIGATKYKLMAFVTSAVLAGAAGVLYAMNYSSMAPKKFDFNTSILILVFVVLGGIGNIRGSIIAAAFLTYLPELLRNFNLDEYRMLVYAIVLILVMLVTNNPMLKSVFTFAGRKARKEEAQKGGAVQ